MKTRMKIIWKKTNLFWIVVIPAVVTAILASGVPVDGGPK